MQYGTRGGQFQSEESSASNEAFPETLRYRATSYSKNSSCPESPEKTKNEENRPSQSGITENSAFKNAAIEFQRDKDNDKHCYVLDLCCPRVRRSDADTGLRSIWPRQYCRTLEQFLTCIKVITRKALICVPMVKEITRRLRCSNDSSSEFHKLSIIGGNLWLLTYAIGDLMDPSGQGSYQSRPQNQNPDVQLWIETNCQVLEDLAREIQAFVALTEEFSIKTRDIREIGAKILKQIQKQFNFTKNPFLFHPEINIKTHRTRQPAPKARSLDPEDHNVSVGRWSTRTVLYQDYFGSSWEPFISLDVRNRIAVFATFLRESLHLLNGLARQFQTPDNALRKIRLPNATRRSSLLDITTLMLTFISKYDRSSDQSEEAEDISTVQETMEAFWYTLDAVDEAAFELHNIVKESRNIMRTCYIYILHFYKWKLCEFDSLAPGRLDPAIQKYQNRLNRFIAKLISAQKLEDVAMFLSFTEFSNSPYQNLVHEYPISSQGNLLKLE